MSDRYLARIKAAQNQELGPFAEIPETQLFEGASTRLHRADGSQANVEMQHLTASTLVPHDVQNMDSLTVASIFRALDDLGRQMGREKINQLLHIVDTTAQEVGNVGIMRDPDGFLEALDKWRMDFDKDGRPTSGQVIVGSEEAKKKFEETLRRIEEDPKLSKKYEDMMRKKWQDFNDREAARKLAE